MLRFARNLVPVVVLLLAGCAGPLSPFRRLGEDVSETVTEGFVPFFGLVAMMALYANEHGQWPTDRVELQEFIDSIFIQSADGDRASSGSLFERNIFRF